MYGNINVTDCNLLNNKMSQESDSPCGRSRGDG